MQDDKPKYLRGTILLGAPGTGKTFLMQHLALGELRRREDARLVFVGAPSRMEPIVALAEGSRVAEEGEGRVLIKGERMTAFFGGADLDENEAAAAAGRRLVLETMRAALVPAKRQRFILAVDEVFAFFRTEAERDELFFLLTTLLDAPVPSITFFISFQSVSQIRNHSGFGATAVEMFKRFHEKFIFKSHETHDVAALAGCPIANPVALRRGEAVHVIHDLSELVDIGLEGNGVVYARRHELKSVGSRRAREIRGVSMSEPLATKLCAGLLLLAALAGVRVFILYQTEWAKSPGLNAGVAFYILTIIAAALSPRLFRHMRAWLAAAIIAASASRPREKHLSEDLG